MKENMTQYTTSKDISEMFETIEAAENQEEAIRSYLSNNAGLRRFIVWYNTFDPSLIANTIEYHRDAPLKYPVQLIKLLGDLESLPRYGEVGQTKIMSKILAKVSNSGMMLLENCLTNDLRVYYPVIEWDLFKKFGCEVKDAAPSE